jgi:hypothetical protein
MESGGRIKWGGRFPLPTNFSVKAGKRAKFSPLELLEGDLTD